MIKKTLTLGIALLLIAGCAMSLDKEGQSSNQDKELGEVQTPIDHDKAETDVFRNTYTTILMENLESTGILLHEKTTFTNIEFSVRNNLNYSAGKDIYSFSFLTSSKPEDTFEAYKAY